jgi:hypothetical protein
MGIKYINLRPSKIYPNWDFWFENKPSGNPISLYDGHLKTRDLQRGDENRAPAGTFFVVHFTIEILDLEQVYWHRSCKHFGEKKLVKSLLISTIDKVIYYIGTF